MSVDSSRTTALSALVIDRRRCCSAEYVSSIAFQVVRAETPTLGRIVGEELGPVMGCALHNF